MFLPLILPFVGLLIGLLIIIVIIFVIRSASGFEVGSVSSGVYTQSAAHTEHFDAIGVPSNIYANKYLCAPAGLCFPRTAYMLR